MTALSSIKLDTSGIKRIAGQLDPRAFKIIRKGAFDVEKFTKESIAAYPAVDTGAYMASVYTSVSDGESNYSKQRSEAKGLNPDAEFTQEEKPSGLGATIGASVEYAVHVEMGTTKMGARPSLVPSLERIRKSFTDAWKELTE